MYSLGFLLTLVLFLLTLFSANVRHWQYLKGAYPLWSVDSWCVSFFWVSAFAATTDVQILNGEESKHLQLPSCRNLIIVTDKEK